MGAWKFSFNISSSVKEHAKLLSVPLFWSSGIMQILEVFFCFVFLRPDQCNLKQVLLTLAVGISLDLVFYAVDF